MDRPSLWWRTARRWQPTARLPAARDALAKAYRFLVEPIAGLSDEGLRRNYLNKIDTHREIVAAWLADAGKRGSGPKQRIAHLTGKTSLREPFERLVDTGLRLNELRSAAELHEFLIDEATELSGAERVLLVLEIAAGPAARRLAGSQGRGRGGAVARHHARIDGGATHAHGQPDVQPGERRTSSSSARASSRR